MAKPPTPKSGSPSEKQKSDDGTTPPPKKLKSSKPLKNPRQVEEWKTDTAGLRKLQDDMQNVPLFSITPRCQAGVRKLPFARRVQRQRRVQVQGFPRPPPHGSPPGIRYVAEGQPRYRMTILPHNYCPITFHPPVFFSDNVGVKHLHFDHSPVVHITPFIKNNNNNNKNTPEYPSGLVWALHLHIFIFASLPSIYCTTICTSKCTIECHRNFNSFPTTSHRKNSPPLVHPIPKPSVHINHFFRSSLVYWYVHKEGHPHCPASTTDRGIPKRIWIRSLELPPPSFSDDRDSPLGLPKSSLRTCPSLIRWPGAPDLQPITRPRLPRYQLGHPSS